MEKNSFNNLITLKEISELLKVSRHTVQAWISPSSPNHRPEFARLARHAGRKTVFLKDEVFEWLNHRRGPIYSERMGERSPYWRDRFISGRGMLKGILKLEETLSSTGSSDLVEDLLGLDTEPLLIWLADSPGAERVFRMIRQASGLIISVPLCNWVLRRVGKSGKKFEPVREFLLMDGVFELAPFNEAAMLRGLELPKGIGDLPAQNYSLYIRKGRIILSNHQ